MVIAACAGPSPAPDAQAPMPPGLTIAAVVAPIDGVVRVTYDIVRSDAPLPSTVRLAFPHRWAGRADLGDDIAGARATYPDGSAVSLARDATGVTDVPTNGFDSVRVDYEVAPSRRILTAASRFRALLSADRFYAPGLAMLAVPLNLPSEVLDAVGFRTACTEPQWCIQSTVTLDGPMAMSRLSDAAFFAGDFDRVDRARDGRSVTLWLQQGVNAGPHALADLALAVVEAQEALLTSDDAAQTRAVVLLREDDPAALNGAGRAGGFVLELGAGATSRSAGLVELLAHENLHRLNGHRLVYAASDEFATMWFREGVTEYVALRNAAESGLVAPMAFFRALGKALANYHGNPRMDAAAGSVGDAFWSDRDLRRLPYDKGALLGLLIDLRLREGGNGSLDGFLASLRQSAATGRVLITNSGLRDALERYSGERWETFWADYVIGSEALPVFERLEETGLQVVERVEPAPWFGLRTSMTVDGDWFVSSVEPNSPAARAGLRAGMALAGEPSVPEGPVDAVAVLDVDTGRGTQQVVIRAGQGQRRTFAFLADDDVYLDAFGLGVRR